MHIPSVLGSSGLPTPILTLCAGKSLGSTLGALAQPPLVGLNIPSGVSEHGSGHCKPFNHEFRNTYYKSLNISAHVLRNQDKSARAIRGKTYKCPFVSIVEPVTLRERLPPIILWVRAGDKGP